MLTAEQKVIAGQIWEEIGKAERILLHFHRSADGDSVSSTMSMALVLMYLGKQVTIANGDQVPDNFVSYVDWEIVKKEPIENLDVKGFDIHLCVDSAAWSQICHDLDAVSDQFKQMLRINIDHHVSNTEYGNINFVMPDKVSCAEVLYQLFLEWKIEMSQQLLDTLMLGMVTDSGGFKYQTVTSDTLQTAAELLEKGGSLYRANIAAYMSASFVVMKYWATILNRMEFDQTFKLVWAAIDYEVIKQLGETAIRYEETSNLLLTMVDGSDFGVLMVEKEPNYVSVSMRGRTGRVRVNEIAKQLGGGGHPFAAGARLLGVTLEEAKQKVFEAIAKVYPELGEP